MNLEKSWPNFCKAKRRIKSITTTWSKSCKTSKSRRREVSKGLSTTRTNWLKEVSQTPSWLMRPPLPSRLLLTRPLIITNKKVGTICPRSLSIQVSLFSTWTRSSRSSTPTWWTNITRTSSSYNQMICIRTTSCSRSGSRRTGSSEACASRWSWTSRLSTFRTLLSHLSRRRRCSKVNRILNWSRIS